MTSSPTNPDSAPSKNQPTSTSLAGVDGDSLAAAGIRVEIAGPVLQVVLDRPDSGNAMSPATWRAFATIGAHVPEETRVVVLRTVGDTFSIGLDRAMFSPAGIPGERSLAELVSGSDADADAALGEFQAGFTWWRNLDAITIAVVQGEAVGAGFHLALACDLRVLSADAKLCMPEAAYGVVPDLGGTKLLVDAVGYPRALEIAATGRWIDADEARLTGLANVVAPVDGLDAAVDALTQTLLSGPDASVRAVKSLLRDAGERSLEEQRAAERTAQIARVRELVHSTPAGQ